MSDLADHPIASIFPLLPEPELRDLAQDIKANGLKSSICTFEGQILDGRNRYRACQIAGVSPHFEPYEGKDPLGLVVSLNLKRRHLNESQRAMVAARLANMRQGARTDTPSPNSDEVSLARAAEMLNVSRAQVADAKAIMRDAPEKATEVANGKTTIHRAKKEIKKKQKAEAQRVAAAAVSKEAKKDLESVCRIECCSFEKLLADCEPDAVITDPPYPEEFLPLYGKLAKACAKVPLVAVMCGHSYLPRVFADMCQHLEYRWTMAYMLPGGQAVQVWGRKVSTFWKPVLLFGEAMDWIGDVCISAPNDNDKDHHHWGQSESGFADLIERLTKPGQLVCDPFLGGGTTAAVCFKLGRKFVGCDISKVCVAESRNRVEALL